MKHCSIPKCDGKYYAKSYCKKHYAYFVERKKYRKRVFCLQCSQQTTADVSKICSSCKIKNKRQKRYGTLDGNLIRVMSKIGSNNPQWKGGVSEYRKHAEMKRNRLFVLKRDNYVCVKCGGEAKVIHHIDKTKTNHTPDNLLSLCLKCHHKLHDENYNSLFKKTYGLSVHEISQMFNKSIGTIYKYHYKGQLHNKINLLQTNSIK